MDIEEDLLLAAARKRALGALVDISAAAGPSQSDPLTGRKPHHRNYSTALLSMLTRANRSEQFHRTREQIAAGISAEIADDADPHVVERGKAG